MSKWMMLSGGRVEKKIKNLLEGSLTVTLPWKGEGVPLPTVYPPPVRSIHKLRLSK